MQVFFLIPIELKNYGYGTCVGAYYYILMLIPPKDGYFFWLFICIYYYKVGGEPREIIPM